MGYYPIGKLQLNLHRISTDSISKMSVSHSWKTNGGESINRQDYFGESPSIFIDTSLNIESVADILTKVVITVFYENGNRVEIGDSLFCNRNSISIFNMTY